MKTYKKIEVVPYNPEWSKMFEIEAAKIKQVLGNNCVAVHHVGSTSVPGLAAKPKIDVIAVIKDPANAIVPLKVLGYQYKGECNIPMRLFFRLKEENNINLHVYEDKNPEIELNLLFRDYLREHPDVRDEYAKLKIDLLKEKSSFEIKSSFYSGYNLGKNAFIRNVLQKAGFNRIRLMQCTHYAEWDAAKLLRQKYFSNKASAADISLDGPEHVHLVLYQGVEIIGYAHVEFCPKVNAIIHMLVIDKSNGQKGFDKQFRALIEKWLNKNIILY